MGLTTCPHCHDSMEITSDLHGMSVECLHCGKLFVAPLESTGTSGELGRGSAVALPDKLDQPLKQSKWAAASAAAGIMGLLASWATGCISIAAMAFGYKALRDIRRSEGWLVGTPAAVFGMAVGCIGWLISVVLFWGKIANK